MYDSHNIATSIKATAKEKNIIIKKMLSDCELGSNTMSSMYHGKSISSDSLAKIADYLDCSVDYLLGRADIPDAIHSSNDDARNGTAEYIMTANQSEALLLIEFRSLTPQGKEYILQTLDMVKEKYKKPDSISQMEEIG